MVTDPGNINAIWLNKPSFKENPNNFLKNQNINISEGNLENADKHLSR